MHWFPKFARRLSRLVATPAATVAAFLLVTLWLVSGPIFRFSDGWQLFINTMSSIVTFLMVFALSNAQLHDTDTLDEKLDLLVRALSEANDRLMVIESQVGAPIPKPREHSGVLNVTSATPPPG